MAAIAFVAACSPKSDQTGKPSANGLVAIRVGGSEGINTAIPLFVAMRQGYFREAGLDVTFHSLSGGTTAVVAALKAGEIDVTVGNATQWISEQARGALAGKIIGEISDNMYVFLGGKGITNIAQLKGKIFAISNHNGGDDIYAHTVLSHYGVSPDDVVWLPLGEPASRLSALIAGKVAATELSLTNLPPSARGMVILDPSKNEVPFVSNAIFAREGLLAANKPALRKFVAAIGRASDWIRAHPDEAIPACQDTGTSVEGCKNAIHVAMTAQNEYTWSPTSRVNTRAIAAMLPAIASIVPQAKNLTVADVVDESIAGEQK
jgi:ABC-type nitrate/sulfonate/bicarbonate transport system substrate-binding protein